MMPASANSTRLGTSGSTTVTSPLVATTRATMRAVIQTAYGDSDVFRSSELERPVPGDGEVLVEVRAAGLDRGTWHLMTGRPYLMRIMGFGFSRPNHPVPGLDVAGVVVDVGAGVTRFSVGDEVFGIGKGSFAEFSVAREDKLAHKPALLSFVEAAVLGVSGLTAWQAVCVDGRVASGQRVLIVGASGGVGSHAVQIAKAQGAVVTGVCSAAKADFVRSLGADHVLDHSRDDFADGSTRYDVVIDIGGGSTLARLRRALTDHGTAVLVGSENDGNIVGGMMLKAFASFLLSPFVPQSFRMCMSREHFSGLEELARLVDRGVLVPRVDRTFTLGEVQAAMRLLEAGEVRGKVAITP